VQQRKFAASNRRCTTVLHHQRVAVHMHRAVKINRLSNTAQILVWMLLQHKIPASSNQSLRSLSALAD